MQYFLDGVRFAWGFFFFVALWSKAVAMQPLDSSLEMTELAIDGFGMVVCFFAPLRIVWPLLGSLCCAFVVYHSFFVSDGCECFGPVQFDNRFLMGMELLTIPVCVLGWVKMWQGLESRRLNLCFISLVLFQCAILANLINVFVLGLGVDPSFDLRDGLSKERSGLSLPDDSRATVFVYHSDCHTCLMALHPLVGTRNQTEQIIFLDVSGKPQPPIDSAVASWRSVNGFPIGIRRVPTVVIVRQTRLVHQRDD